ncbi:EF-hand domain-containing protein [Rhodopirellula sp. MGV]|uniref:EF-hand domain-containing protein n=1 Tax=Rhodopirellula sp. MGV TaxID=2023130 RepID=UPI001E2AB44E|nr:EF-hand domain-containing protein [Rhodopirellula sp. MGV]
MKRLLFSMAVCIAPTMALAQPPGGPGSRGGEQGGPRGGNRGMQNGFGGPGRNAGQSPIEKLMQFDANGDGVLSEDELSDPRLQNLFKRADANGDGTLTQYEMAAMFTNQSQAGSRPGGPPQGFGGGPGGFGGGPPQGFGGGPPQGFGGGPGGPNGFQPPRPGTILPEQLIEMLELTDAQRKKLAALQELVDKRMEKILTEEQAQKLQFGPQGPPHEGGPRREGGPRSQGDRPPRE